jgi:hypothetical protein
MLPLSSNLKSCQRTVKQVREISGKGNKVETITKTTYQGYLLAERLSFYLEKRAGKSPEAEPFFRFIKELINRMSARTPSDFVLPKSFFSPPNTLVRKYLRHGPEIKSKGTTKPGNTYVPFSFAKSLECRSMPETTRKSLTNIGSNVSRHIDSINSYPVLDQSSIIEDAIRYISLSYALSDDLRK